MCVFLLATCALEEEYKLRTAQLKSLADGIDDGVYIAMGGDMHELVGIINSACFDLVELRLCGCSFGTERGARNSAELFAFTPQVLQKE